MPSFDDFGGWGQLARVRYIDGRRVFLVLPNGQLGWAESDEPVDFLPETTVHVTDNHFEQIPDEVWREEPWVAVVKIKLPDVTIVEFSGSSPITNGLEELDLRLWQLGTRVGPR